MYMQIRMPMACFLILLYAFFQYKRKKKLDTFGAKIFEAIFVSSILHALSAVVTEYTVNNRDKVPEAFNYIWHVIFMLSITFTCYTIYGYLNRYIERATGKKRKKSMTVMSVLYVVCAAAEVFLPIEYADTPHGSYSIGMKAYDLYVIVIYIMIMMVYSLIRYRQVIDSGIFRTLVYSVMIFVTSALIQIIFPYMLLTELAMTLIVIGIMMNTEDPHLYVDYKTGLYNESGCCEMFGELMLNRKEFKIGVCVLIGDNGSVASAVEKIGKRIREYDGKGLVCGNPTPDIVLVMPTVLFSEKKRGYAKLPDTIDGAKCFSEVMSFNSQQAVEDIMQSISGYRIKCVETERNTDELTGLLGRTAYSMKTSDIAALGQPFSFVMIDIDNFKDINDTYGHIIGDDVLKYAAYAFRSSVRSSDLVCRMGGDEFSIVLCGISDKAVLERIIKKIMKKMQRTLVSDGTELKVTLSVGAKILLPEKEKLAFDELYNEADEALYEAKNAGKNRLCVK